MGLFSWFTATGWWPPHDPIDITSPEFKANPFPYYARLRAESPVHRVNLRIGSSPWLVTRYDDVVTVLKDERFAKQSSNAMTTEQLARQPWFLNLFKTKWLTPLIHWRSVIFSAIACSIGDPTKLARLVSSSGTIASGNVGNFRSSSSILRAVGLETRDRSSERRTSNSEEPRHLGVCFSYSSQ